MLMNLNMWINRTALFKYDLKIKLYLKDFTLCVGFDLVFSG